jgi:hypothetical protein
MGRFVLYLPVTVTSGTRVSAHAHLRLMLKTKEPLKQECEVLYTDRQRV